MKFRHLACITGAAAIGLGACGSSPSSTSTTTSGAASSTTAASTTTTSSAPVTLTIWLMTGEISSKTYDAVNAEFKQKHPNATVNVQIQQWSGIASKLTTALASNNPPDAMEIGNTDVPEFAASGGLMDLSSDKSQFQNSSNWLTGLSAPAEVNGKLYAAPLLAGDRAIIYNKQMFTKAGITSCPTTIADLKADGAKLASANSSVSGFSPLYLPGKYWYAGLSWLWDAGGQIATQSGGKWSGALASSASQTGLSTWKDLQNSLSTPASRGVNTNSPDQDQVLASGKAAMIIGGSWEAGSVSKDNPQLTSSDLGACAIPGTSGPAPVFLGGSDIGISQNSPNKQLALEWAEDMTNTTNQTAMVNNDGLMPNATNLLSLKSGDPFMSVYYNEANKSDGTPASPGWATIEGDNTMENLFSSIASGTASVAAAAATADSHFDTVLNQGS